MKKLISVFVILMLAAVTTTGFAQVNAGSVNITPTIGFYKFEGNEDLESSIALGLRAGYFFTKYIGIEGYAHYVPTKILWSNGTSSDIKFVGYGIEGIVNLLPNGAFVPFLAVGVGGAHYSNAFEDTTEDRRDKFTADYGAGVKYFLSENIALRADVRHIVPFDGRHNNLLGTVGLTFAFGGAKKAAPAPEPAPAPAPVAPAPAPVVAPPPPPPPPVVQEVKKPAAAAPAIIEKGRVTLNVLFDTNKAVIKTNSFREVDNLITVMKDYPELNVTIEGHTDNVGSAASNKKLSQRRADAVKKYMVGKGIDASRLTAVGFGLEKPIASNATKEGRAKNRRVEAAADYVYKK